MLGGNAATSHGRTSCAADDSGMARDTCLQTAKRHASILIPVGIACVAAIAGCRDPLAPDPGGAPRMTPSRSTASLSAGGPGRPQSLDDEFVALAQRVPGFGGMYYDTDGTPVVWLTNPAASATVDGEIREFARTHPYQLGEEPRTPRYQRAKHDFPSLKRWHDAALPKVASLPGLAYTDVDEVHNVVKLAVVDAGAQSAILATAAALGIPTDAIVTPIEKRYGFQAAASAMPGQDLTEAIRPAIGGTRIVIGGMGGCTLGFNAQKVRYAPQAGSYVYDYQHYFVTNAHCMPNAGFASGAIVAQGPYFDYQYYVGQEDRQPPWGTTADYSDCPPGQRCSLADAALVRYTYSDGDMAIIARPAGGANGHGTTLDAFNPVFEVIDSTQLSNRQLAGTLVSKVGQASGWTAGYVAGTCFNQQFRWPGFFLLCQDSYGSQTTDGDSGSPIFQVHVNGYYARMVGIHWGGNGQEGAMSPYVYVRWELTRADYNTYCGGVPSCWLGLNVSGYWN
jgi:hypothetical protein